MYVHGFETAKRLEKESNRHVQLVVEENGTVAILYATHWTDDEVTTVTGRLSPTRARLHSNAPGKAMLATLASDRVSEIVERHGLARRTEQTIVEESALRSKLKTIREQGYAVDRGELIDGNGGVGAAIRTDDQLYGAIAVYGPVSEIRAEIESGDLVSRVREHAEAIRANIVFGSSA